MIKNIIFSLVVILSAIQTYGRGNDGYFPMGDVLGTWKSSEGLKLGLWPYTEDADRDQMLVYVRVEGSEGELIADGLVIHKNQNKLFRGVIFDANRDRISFVLKAFKVGKGQPKQYRLQMRVKYLDDKPGDRDLTGPGTIGLQRDSRISR